MKIIAHIPAMLIVLCAAGQPLETYYRLASENNPALRAALLEAEAAVQQVAQVSALPDPEISVSAFGRMIETRLGPQMAIFSLSQMFPWFGTLKAKNTAAALVAEARYKAYLNMRNEVLYKISASYYALYELHRWQRAEEENIRLLQALKTLVLTAYKNGKAGMVDVLEADNQLRKSETNLAVLREKERPLLASFNILLNRNVSEPVVLPDSLPVYDLPDDYLKDSLLVHNAMLKELELRQMAAAAGERAALKESLPMIGLGLNYSVIGRSDVPVEGSGRDAFMPMVTVTLPVYRKKYQAAIKESQLMQQQYALQREAAGNELLAEYENAFFEAKQQRNWVALYSQLADQTLRAKRILITAYGSAEKDFNEILRLQQQWLEYEKLKASAQAAHQSAVARIHYLTSKTLIQ